MNGILIQIEPVIVRAGPLTLRWFGVCLLLALAVGVWLTIRRAPFVSTWTVIDLASWALPIGLLGARAFHVLEHWEYYATRPGAIVDLAGGGLNAWGGFVAGGLAVVVLARRRGLPAARLGDAATPGLALAEAIGRLGCFLNGDGQGRPSQRPWATQYSSNDALTPDYGVPRHPAQVYQGLADLAILGLLWLVRDPSLPPGARFWLWLAVYGLSRLVIGLVRLDPPFLLGLQQGQLLGIAAAVVGAFAIIRSALASPRTVAARRG